MTTEDESEVYQNQRRLALDTIDDLTELKIQLLEASLPVPSFINNALTYLKKKYLVQDKSIGQMLRKRYPG